MVWIPIVKASSEHDLERLTAVDLVESMDFLLSRSYCVFEMEDPCATLMEFVLNLTVPIDDSTDLDRVILSAWSDDISVSLTSTGMSRNLFKAVAATLK